jgi:REP-associated tyrosine transposase
MNYNPAKHHRKSIRLKGYDYSQKGLYFITICTRHRSHIFGKIEKGKMILNEYGEIAEEEWERSEEIRNEIELCEYIIMPNHFHGIVEINAGANGRSPVRGISGVRDDSSNREIIICERENVIPKMQSRSVSSLVSGYKSVVTKRINQIRSMPGEKLWQRNYWEHIIRNEDEYLRISNYIKNNPMKWYNDKLNGGRGNIVMESLAPYGEEIWMVWNGKK